MIDEEELLQRIKKVAPKYRLYVVIKSEAGIPFYLLYRKHANDNIKFGFRLGRRNTVNGLRLLINKFILNENDFIEKSC